MRQASSAEDAGLGLHVRNITDDDRKYYSLGDAKGVLVDNVVPGSQADNMSFNAGDVIEQSGEEAAPSLEQVIPTARKIDTRTAPTSSCRRRACPKRRLGSASTALLGYGQHSRGWRAFARHDE